MSTNMDAVTREQVEAWAKLAGIEHFTEQGLARLGDFAIFARQDRVQAESVREPCKFDMFSSRVCQYGSRSCIVDHAPSTGDQS